MRQNIILDIFLGLILLTVWLNVANDNFQRFKEKLPEQTRFSIYSLLIISIPFFGDLALNNSKSSYSTFFASLMTAIIALVLRETFMWYSQQNRIKEELFSELYGNYQSLQHFQHIFNLTSHQLKDQVKFEKTWNDSLISKWKSLVYDNYQGKIQTRKIYDQKVIEELKDIYEKMSSALQQIKNDNSTFTDPHFLHNIFLDENFGILSQIKNVLITMDERKAKDLFTSE